MNKNIIESFYSDNEFCKGFIKDLLICNEIIENRKKYSKKTLNTEILNKMLENIYFTFETYNKFKKIDIHKYLELLLLNHNKIKINITYDLNDWVTLKLPDGDNIVNHLGNDELTVREHLEVVYSIIKKLYKLSIDPENNEHFISDTTKVKTIPKVTSTSSIKSKTTSLETSLETSPPITVPPDTKKPKTSEGVPLKQTGFPTNNTKENNISIIDSIINFNVLTADNISDVSFNTGKDIKPIPKVSTAAPVVTSKPIPKVSTTSPVITTISKPIPNVSTAAPIVSTAAPIVTTAPAPILYTTSPVITTQPLETTTPISSVSTPAPILYTTSPVITTQPLETTTPISSVSTPAPILYTTASTGLTSPTTHSFLVTNTPLTSTVHTSSPIVSTAAPVITTKTTSNIPNITSTSTQENTIIIELRQSVPFYNQTEITDFIYTLFNVHNSTVVVSYHHDKYFLFFYRTNVVINIIDMGNLDDKKLYYIKKNIKNKLSTYNTLEYNVLKTIIIIVLSIFILNKYLFLKNGYTPEGVSQFNNSIYTY
uniref:Uncharacterized protein n=1 Tax=Megaviridae environmental sample TaxID=1737588 RepID=A0A5J6VKA8_9VIRU|nr:MAG: hypothetical protein [Megaviridae environmental sample]